MWRQCVRLSTQLWLICTHEKFSHLGQHLSYFQHFEKISGEECFLWTFKPKAVRCSNGLFDSLLCYFVITRKNPLKYFFSNIDCKIITFHFSEHMWALYISAYFERFKALFGIFFEKQLWFNHLKLPRESKYGQQPCVCLSKFSDSCGYRRVQGGSL